MRVTIRTFRSKNCQALKALALAVAALSVSCVATLLFVFLPAPAALGAIWICGAGYSFLGPILFMFLKVQKRIELPASDSLQDILRASGIRLRYFTSIQVSAPEAYAQGFGPTATIVVSEGLLVFPREQFEAVFAHEVAHHAYGDPFKGTVAALAVLSFLAWSSAAIGQGVWGGVVLSSIFTFIILPDIMRVSRWKERRADRYAAYAIADPRSLADAFSSMLSCWNLSGLEIKSEMPWWVDALQIHPNIRERIGS